MRSDSFQCLVGERVLAIYSYAQDTSHELWIMTDYNTYAVDAEGD